MTSTSRRVFIFGAAACAAAPGARAADSHETLNSALARIERGSGGRLGVAVLDIYTNARTGHRESERFPMCSTFKLLACAAVLSRVEAKQERLDRRIAIEAKDVVPDSSFIKAPVAGGMTLAALCEAAMTYSDNTAANLILHTLGGPAGVTAYARQIGDGVTRLDRVEPDLNEAVPGDARDTTTPHAMLQNVQTLALGNALAAPSKELLIGWLTGNKTGGKRVRAGLPAPWRVGDKTGAGERGTTNDVGIIWPPQRTPTLFAVYLTGTGASADARNATLAEVGRAIAAAVAAQ